MSAMDFVWKEIQYHYDGAFVFEAGDELFHVGLDASERELRTAVHVWQQGRRQGSAEGRAGLQHEISRLLGIQNAAIEKDVTP